MAAVYPVELRNWTTKYDYTTIVFADHFNTAQDELLALYRTVGLTPHIARNDPGATPASMRPIVDWLANAPPQELDKILELIEGIGDKSYAEIMEELREIWPDWMAVAEG